MPLSAQEIGSAVLGQRLEQQRQGNRVHRLVAYDREGVDAAVMRCVVMLVEPFSPAMISRRAPW